MIAFFFIVDHSTRTTSLLANIHISIDLTGSKKKRYESLSLSLFLSVSVRRRWKLIHRWHSRERTRKEDVDEEKRERKTTGAPFCCILYRVFIDYSSHRALDQT